MEIVELSRMSAFRPAGLRQGDIILGMDRWETLSMANVDFILSRPEFAHEINGPLKAIKVVFLRGTDVMYTNIALERLNDAGT